MGTLATVGLLAAERHRRSTGKGQLVNLSLSDVAFAMRLRAFTGSSSAILLNELALLPNNSGFIEFFNGGATPVLVAERSASGDSFNAASLQHLLEIRT